jgi:N-acetyl-anhydromuramyl-L-alanine amidase AmpD
VVGSGYPGTVYNGCGLWQYAANGDATFLRDTGPSNGAMWTTVGLNLRPWVTAITLSPGVAYLVGFTQQSTVPNMAQIRGLPGSQANACMTGAPYRSVQINNAGATQAAVMKTWPASALLTPQPNLPDDPLLMIRRRPACWPRGRAWSCTSHLEPTRRSSPPARSQTTAPPARGRHPARHGTSGEWKRWSGSARGGSGDDLAARDRRDHRDLGRGVLALKRDWIPSPNYSSRGGSGVRLVIVHTAEGALTYQALGNFFGSGSAGVSSHTGIDDTPGRIGEYVKRPDKAWTAGDANPYSVNVELCGFASWSPADWERHPVMLDNCARWIAEECRHYGIPIVKVGASEATHGGRGVCGHVDVSGPGGHWDPGPDFPWSKVIAQPNPAGRSAARQHPAGRAGRCPAAYLRCDWRLDAPDYILKIRATVSPAAAISMAAGRAGWCGAWSRPSATLRARSPTCRSCRPS